MTDKKPNTGFDDVPELSSIKNVEDWRALTDEQRMILRLKGAQEWMERNNARPTD